MPVDLRGTPGLSLLILLILVAVPETQENQTTGCEDAYPESCPEWSKLGRCDTTPVTMAMYCPVSCHWCPGFQLSQNCLDEDRNCSYWALVYGCDNDWMRQHCNESCAQCSDTTSRLPEVQRCVDQLQDCAERVYQDPRLCHLDNITTECQVTCGNCDMCEVTTEITIANNQSQNPAFQSSHARGETMTWVCDIGTTENDVATWRSGCDPYNATWTGPATDGESFVSPHITCPEPPVVPNAYRSVTSYDVCTNVTYTCYQGYEVTSGDVHRTCLTSGRYSGQAPVCSPRCPAPGMPGVEINVTSSANESVAVVHCGNEYGGENTNPSFVVTCDADVRSWDMSPVRCQETIPLFGATQSGLIEEIWPWLAHDDNESTCSVTSFNRTTQWEARMGEGDVTHLHYVIDVTFITTTSVDEGTNLNGINYTLEVVDEQADSLCGEVIDDTGRSWSRMTARVTCQRTDGQYPLGHTVRITGSGSPDSLHQLILCDVRVRGWRKHEYCPSVPEVVGLRLHSAHESSGGSSVETNQTYYTTNITARYVCDGGKSPLGGEDLALCDVTKGTWTLPTLRCTDSPNYAAGQKVLEPYIDSPRTALMIDGDDATCVQPYWYQSNGFLRLTLPHVLELDTVSVVMGNDLCFGNVTASVQVHTKDVSDFKTCSSSETEVTKRSTKVTVRCPQRPVTWDKEVLINASCVSPANHLHYRTICEIRVWGRVFDQALECYQTERGEDYKGRVSETKGGQSCLPWDTSEYYGLTHGPEQFPDGSLAEAGNMCRNPGGLRDEPWCYISLYLNGSCGVPACNDVCKIDAMGQNYRGTMNQTKGGKPCVAWDSPGLPLFRAADFSDGAKGNNYCRNPGGLQSAPWCYTNTSPVEHQECDISSCSDYMSTTSTPAPATGVLRTSAALSTSGGSANMSDVRNTNTDNTDKDSSTSGIKTTPTPTTVQTYTPSTITTVKSNIQTTSTTTTTVKTTTPPTTTPPTTTPPTTTPPTTTPPTTTPPTTTPPTTTPTTAVEVPPSTTSHPRKGGQKNKRMCACRCGYNKPSLTSFLNQSMTSQGMTLTSMKRRKMTSAGDERSSALGIGVLGLVFLFSFLGLFLAADVMTALAFLWELVCGRRGGSRKGRNSGTAC